MNDAVRIRSLRQRLKGLSKDSFHGTASGSVKTPSRGDSRLRDVISQLDYPDIEDHFASKHRAMERLRRKEDEEAWNSDAE